MAIISSYPTITPTSSDLVLIVDTSEDGNPTKTATVDSLSSQFTLKYTTYVAQWKQDLATAPESDVLQNTTGLTWTWTYVGVGVYDLTASASYNTTKVYAVVSSWQDTTDSIPASTGTRSTSIKTFGPNSIRVTNQDAADSSYIDDVPSGFIEIRIYS